MCTLSSIGAKQKDLQEQLEITRSSNCQGQGKAATDKGKVVIDKGKGKGKGKGKVTSSGNKKGIWIHLNYFLNAANCV